MASVKFEASDGYRTQVSGSKEVVAKAFCRRMGRGVEGGGGYYVSGDGVVTAWLEGITMREIDAICPPTYHEVMWSDEERDEYIAKLGKERVVDIKPYTSLSGYKGWSIYYK